MRRHEDHADVSLLAFAVEAVIFLSLFFGLPALGFLLAWSGQP